MPDPNPDPTPDPTPDLPSAPQPDPSSDACQRCGGPMEGGFIVDYAHGGRLQTKWVPGEPREGWLGVKDTNSLPITTYRCTDCGWLDSYALPK